MSPDLARDRGRDRIAVTGIRAWGRHGVLAAERELGQEFSADVVLHVPTAAAARADALERTVNYAEAAAAVAEEIAGEPVDLIETLADRIARRVLEIGAPMVRRCEITVHKPAAPVGLPVGDVALSIARDAEPVEVVLAVGTNLGDRAAHLEQALAQLAEDPQVRIAWTAPVVETDPVGGPEQGAFWNSAFGIVTDLAPFELLELCHRIEHSAGRERLVRWGPRTLDLDIITYGELRSEDEELTLPHPRAAERAFVLHPWAAARPEAELPGRGPIRALLAAAADRDGVRPGPQLAGYGRS